MGEIRNRCLARSADREMSMTSSNDTFPMVTFTELTDKNAILTKQYEMFMGCFVKKYPGIMSDGSANQIAMQLDQLIPYFAALTEHQAICPGVTENPSATITVKSRETRDRIARTKDNFKFPNNEPSLILFDVDADDSPGSTKIHSPADLVDIIETFLPSTSSAAYMAMASASSGIRCTDPDELLTSNCGFHIYFVAQDGSDIPRFIETLFKKLVLKGFGHIKISRSGSQLLRTVIDGAIKSPERIDYVAPAVISGGLYRRTIKPSLRPGCMLDTAALRDLTPDEDRQYADLVEQLKSDANERASIVRNQYAERKSLELGMPKKKLLQMLESADGGQLNCDFVLTLNDNSTVAVDEVCLNPNSWDRVSLRDPLDPDDGPSKAIIMVGDDNIIRIHSFAHGGSLYKLIGRPIDLYSSLHRTDIGDTEKFLKEINREIIGGLDRKDEVTIL
jgi:hypothetical protein